MVERDSVRAGARERPKGPSAHPRGIRHRADPAGTLCPPLPHMPTPSSRAKSLPMPITLVSAVGPSPISVAPLIGAPRRPFSFLFASVQEQTNLPAPMSTGPPPHCLAETPPFTPPPVPPRPAAKPATPLQYPYAARVGDSFWRIANKERGDPGAVDASKALNLDVLEGKNHVVVITGTKRRLPARPVAIVN